ncbi:MAG: hypothetical protein ACI9FR_000071 [Cryomorphaceae bacterium]|jgi:hypothetical protein
MNCLDFKRLALSEPNSREISFIEHSKDCPECLKYVGSVQKMDSELNSSLQVQMPKDLVARLQLTQEMQQEATSHPNNMRGYAVAASFAVALFIAGFMVSNQFGSNSNIDRDYQALLSGVVEHMNEQPITPVWDSARANRNANALLASYDVGLRIKPMDNLQFSKICPMGVYRGLHASLETADGQVTFAFIKGKPVDGLFDVGYEGYVSRVKPVRGGNLIIVSRTRKSLNEADNQLENAMYWDI